MIVWALHQEFHNCLMVGYGTLLIFRLISIGRHSVIWIVPISTSESILIYDINKKKSFLPVGFKPVPLDTEGEGYTTQLRYFSSVKGKSDTVKGMSDMGYRKKLHTISDIMSDFALSVWYRRFRCQAQSDTRLSLIPGSVWYCWSRISD
jgi:hypothetical protein